jgi:LPXTG-motif cell wall-anchored protein
MHNKIAAAATVLALFVMAGAALAQNADQNTGGPTKNTLRMTLAEPAEGAAIMGSLVRVAVGYNHNAFGTGQGTRFGETNFPQPRFDVYLDDTLKTTLKGTESNVANLENVLPGSHKVTVVALNVSGEIIDRKEVNITTSAVPIAESRRHVAREVPREPAPMPVYEPPPAPIEATALPKTGSESPKVALAGVALILCGLLLARKVR